MSAGCTPDLGSKCFIGNAGRASFVIVFATTDPTRGQFGIQPLIVDRDTPGMTIDDAWPMLGLRALRVSHLRFEDCWVPEDRLLGRPDGRLGARAFISAQRSWEYMRPAPTEVREVEAGVYLVRGELYCKHTATDNVIVEQYEQRLEIRDGLMARGRMLIGSSVRG